MLAQYPIVGLVFFEPECVHSQTADGYVRMTLQPNGVERYWWLALVCTAKLMAADHSTPGSPAPRLVA